MFASIACARFKQTSANVAIDLFFVDDCSLDIPALKLAK